MIEHTGGCHCAAVRFRITAPRDIQASQCNCSICSKSGYLGLIVPRSRFELVSGEDDLETYSFNTGVAKHLFCRRCGVKSFYVPRSHPEAYNVNVRCLDPGTVGGLTIRSFNGQEWEKHTHEFVVLEED